jgi:hypothetical protein
MNAKTSSSDQHKETKADKASSQEEAKYDFFF